MAAIIGTLVRSLLQILCTWLVAKGIIEAGSVAALVENFTVAAAAVGSAAVAAWGVWQKYRAAKA